MFFWIPLTEVPDRGFVLLGIFHRLSPLTVYAQSPGFRGDLPFLFFASGRSPFSLLPQLRTLRIFACCQGSRSLSRFQRLMSSTLTPYFLAIPDRVFPIERCALTGVSWNVWEPHLQAPPTEGQGEKEQWMKNWVS